MSVVATFLRDLDTESMTLSLIPSLDVIVRNSCLDKMIRYHVPVVVDILKTYDSLGTPADHLVFLLSLQTSSWMNTDTSGYPISVSPVTFPKRSPMRVCE